MATTSVEAPGGATATQRWLARLALVAAAAAVLVPLLAIGFKAALAVAISGVVGLALTAAGVWWALAHKGLVRWLAVALAVAAPLTVLVLYTSARLTWVVVDADASQIPVGVDGEALLLDTPVRCTVKPAALRVRVPRDRPGVPDPKPLMDWKRLWHIALTVSGPVPGAARSP